MGYLKLNVVVDAKHCYWKEIWKCSETLVTDEIRSPDLL